MSRLDVHKLRIGYHLLQLLGQSRGSAHKPSAGALPLDLTMGIIQSPRSPNLAYHFQNRPTAPVLKRPDMATHSFTSKQAIPVFTPQPQSITGLCLVLILPSHGGYRRLSRSDGWLHTEIVSLSENRTRTRSPIPVLTGLGVG